MIPDGTEVIENNQYEALDYERVFIPKSVVEIQEHAFAECKNLKEVTIEKGSKLKTIGKEAFLNCDNLTRIAFSEGLEKICLGAFQNTKLESVEFPTSL